MKNVTEHADYIILYSTPQGEGWEYSTAMPVWAQPDWDKEWLNYTTDSDT